MMKHSFNRALSSKLLNTCPNPQGVGLYSTEAVTAALEKSGGSLYRRISPVGDPTATIVPVLDQWVEEGRKVKKEQLQHIIKELRRYGRLKHALEISQWMSDKQQIHLSSGDIAARVDLIAKVHGAKEAEEYFESLSKQYKHVSAYATILSCYARERSVEKAEAIMKEMRDSKLSITTNCYNAMLNLYRKTHDREKQDALAREMEDLGVKYDKFTYSILMNTHSEASEIDGMERVLRKMELEPNLNLDWDTYSIAANGFIKADLFEKAFEMLKKSETFITSKEKSSAFDYLLTQYAAIGKKDEVFRIWGVHKEKSKLYNRSYISMITSLLKLDDVESAEKIFEEWESSELTYDFRIPNFLIGAYSRKGLMEKAEGFVEKAKLNGGKPIPITFYYLAMGYINTNKMEKALEAMKTVISTNNKIGWKPSKASLIACLEYLKEKSDVEEIDFFLRLLLDKGIISAEVYDKLLDNMKKGDGLRIDENLLNDSCLE